MTMNLLPEVPAVVMQRADLICVVLAKLSAKSKAAGIFSSLSNSRSVAIPV